MRDVIRGIVRDHGRLAVDVAALDDHADLYEAGLTSHAGIALLLALENRFDVEFPERLLRRRTFESIASIEAAVAELQGGRHATA